MDSLSTPAYPNEGTVLKSRKIIFFQVILKVKSLFVEEYFWMSLFWNVMPILECLMHLIYVGEITGNQLLEKLEKDNLVYLWEILYTADLLWDAEQLLYI